MRQADARIAKTLIRDKQCRMDTLKLLLDGYVIVSQRRDQKARGWALRPGFSWRKVVRRLRTRWE